MLRSPVPVLLRVSWAIALLLWLGNSMPGAQARAVASARPQSAQVRCPAPELPAYGLPPEAITPDSPVAHAGEAPAAGASGAGWAVVPAAWWSGWFGAVAGCRLKVGQQTGPLAPCQRRVVRVALSPQAP